MSFRSQLIILIHNFRKIHGFSRRGFCLAAGLSEHKFIQRLEAGKGASLGNIEKIRIFMASYGHELTLTESLAPVTGKVDPNFPANPDPSAEPVGVPDNPVDFRDDSFCGVLPNGGSI